jgi:hypothetical protein
LYIDFGHVQSKINLLWAKWAIVACQSHHMVKEFVTSKRALVTGNEYSRPGCVETISNNWHPFDGTRHKHPYPSLRRIKMPYFHPHQEWLWQFSSTQRIVWDLLCNESLRWYCNQKESGRLKERIWLHTIDLNIIRISSTLQQITLLEFLLY